MFFIPFNDCNFLRKYGIGKIDKRDQSYPKPSNIVNGEKLDKKSRFSA